MLSIMELIFCVHYLQLSFSCMDQKNPTATNVHGQSAGYSVSNMRSEVVSLIFFQKCDIIFPFSQCQSCSGKCYSFCKCKLKTIITWLTYSVIKMPGTTHLPVEWRFAAMIFTWVGKCSSLDAVDMLIALVKEGKKWKCFICPCGKEHCSVSVRIYCHVSH